MCKHWNCEKEAYKGHSGYCSAHYIRSRKGLDMDAPVRQRGGQCIISDCLEPHFSLGLCRPHYREEHEYTSAKRKGQYRRERKVNKNGYVQYFDPTSLHANSHGYVYEHRAVLGDSIGRPLLSHESAHHKNGDRTDNRLENLELWSSSQPSGQRVEDKLAWAREIIELYGSN